MLLTQLLVQHPEALADIVRRTPLWVGGLLVGLLYLGVSASRARDLSVARLVLMPLAMSGLALWGVISAFGGFDPSGRLAELLALWIGCGATVLALGARGTPPAGTRYDAGTRRFHLPGSWVPLGLILAVFLMKYVIGVQLALEPSLAQDARFGFAVTTLYGGLSGLFAARMLRVLRSTRGPAAGAVTV